MSEIRTAARNVRGLAFEEKLRSLQESSDKDIKAAIDEVPLALQVYFRRISTEYTTEPINYSALLTSILRRNVSVAFATLNYDTLLEMSLAKLSGRYARDLGRESAYKATDGRWQVAKLHGSVNWGYRWVEGRISRDVRDALQRVGLPDTSRSLISMNVGYDLISQEYLHYPALALPVAGKYGFVCPAEMEYSLRDFARVSTAALFIGFSGQDKDLLDFLSKNLQANVRRVDIVGGSDLDAVAGRIASGIEPFRRTGVVNEQSLHNDGFSKYLEEGMDDFLDEVSRH